MPKHESDVSHFYDPLIILEAVPQICRMIFSGLPVRDLLKCSQVSRLWRQEASAVLSTRKCFAFVRGTCDDICTLNSQLESNDCCLINGLSIQIPMDHENCLHRLNEADEEEMTFSRNLVLLPLRYLSFNVSACEATQQLMEQILLGARHNLEELTLSYDRAGGGGSVMPNVGLKFPKLRVIEVHPRSRSLKLDIFRLIRVAPNLLAVRGACWLDELKDHDCRRLDVVTWLNMLPSQDTAATFRSLVLAQPKLTVLLVYDFEGLLMSLSWSTLLLRLLRHSSFTLQRLKIFSLAFIEMQKRGLKLESLICLELVLPQGALADETENIVRNLKLLPTCPSLLSLGLVWEDEVFYVYDTSLESHSETTIGDEVHPLQELTTSNAFCVAAVVPTFVTFFPALSTFGFELQACDEICAKHDHEHFFEVFRVWNEIRTLIELKIHLTGSEYAAPRHSLDALLCGISMEEANELTHHVNEYESCRENCRGCACSLHRLQYCCLRPSVLYAQSLKKVTLTIPRRYKCTNIFPPGLIRDLVFVRSKSLRLSVESYCLTLPAELHCVQTYADVKIVNQRERW